MNDKSIHNADASTSSGGDTAPELQTCAAEAVAAEGCELVEVVVHRAGTKSRIALTVDREGGVTVEDCARVSRRLKRQLETWAGLADTFQLEVSSPGLTRKLTCLEECARFSGRLARIVVRTALEGHTSLRGTLAGTTADGELCLEGSEVGRPVCVPWSVVASAQLDFDPAPGPGRSAAGKRPRSRRA